MARGILFKFLAILLASALLLVTLASGLAVVVLAGSGLYSRDVQELYQEQLSSRLSSLANWTAARYLGEALGGCPAEYLDSEYNPYIYPFELFDPDKWAYVITDRDGKRLEHTTGNFPASQATVFEETVLPHYPMVVQKITYDSSTGERIPDETYSQEELATVPTQATVPQHYYDGETFRSVDENGIVREYVMGWSSPEQPCTVTLYLLPGAYTQENALEWELLEQLWTYRFELIGICVGSLLGFVLVLIYLCCVAAKKWRSEEIRPAGLNRLPLDLYAAAVGTAIFFLAWGCYELITWHLDYFDPWWLLALLVGAMAYAACLLGVCFLFACAAQIKAADGFWYTHSFIGWCIRLAIKLFKILFGWLGKLFAFLGLSCKKAGATATPVAKRIWEFIRALCLTCYQAIVRFLKKLFDLLGKFFRFLWHAFTRFVALLPLTWQWLLTAFALILLMLLIVESRSTGMILLGLLAVMAIVLYGTHCFGTLLESTKRMSKGDLDTKVEDKLLLGSFREYATHLNALADVAVEAARKQMKSERMKAELVTNVSHDIKTPLTSIINYVDLLQKAETEAQTTEYLEVLDRQSQRLKKLIDDLMEMSKASTGNMAVDLTTVDPVEAVNQALGEFSDKLTAADLCPIFQAPEEPLRMIADGRLTWRVLSNLLSNAVKYALPGTRLYIDIAKVDSKVLISLKNISKEQLNVSSDELMERFVRGDTSRNTDGSGLGLNIAKNLMELQKGQLQLLVDGDLFKATLLFPEA